MINIKPIKPVNRKIESYIRSMTKDEKEWALEWKSEKLKTKEEIEKYRKNIFTSFCKITDI
jgi:hypothetical protein